MADPSWPDSYQRNKEETINKVGIVLENVLSGLEKISSKDLMRERREKFLFVGTQGIN